MMDVTSLPATNDYPSNTTRSYPWWVKMIDPTKAFPTLSSSSSIILYFCIVAGVFIVFLFLLWIIAYACSCRVNGNASKKKIKNYENKNDTQRPWNISSTLNNDADMRKHNHPCVQGHARNRSWWEHPSDGPMISWEEYYKMVERKNRTADRKSHPWRANCNFAYVPIENYPSRDQYLDMHGGALENDGFVPDNSFENNWERIHFRSNSGAGPGYALHRNVQAIPKFRVIPRASWSSKDHFVPFISEARRIPVPHPQDVHILQMFSPRQMVQPHEGDIYFASMPDCNNQGQHGYQQVNNTLNNNVANTTIDQRNRQLSQLANHDAVNTNDTIPLDDFAGGEELPLPPTYPAPPTPTLPNRNT